MYTWRNILCEKKPRKGNVYFQEHYFVADVLNQSINQLMFIQKAYEVGVEPEQNLIICDDYYERPPDTGKK